MRFETTSMSSAPWLLQFMQSDISRSWAGRVSCRNEDRTRRYKSTVKVRKYPPKPFEIS